jgi:hypothetical protein
MGNNLISGEEKQKDAYRYMHIDIKININSII